MARRALNGYLWKTTFSCGTTSRGIFRSSRCFRWKEPTSSGPTAGPRGCRPTRSPGRLLDEGRLHVNPGSIYGAAGEGFIRLNIACPRKLLAEGLDRLKRVLPT